MKIKASYLLLLATCLVAGNGCVLHNWLQPVNMPGPEIFVSQPSLPEAIAAINANSNAIRQLSAEGATVALQGYPALKARLAIERPNGLRIQASVLGVGGPVLDVGSNDDLFWFWTQQSLPNANAPQGVYYVRHEDAQQLPLQQWLPIEPKWLTEALGVVMIDPNAPAEGPIAKGPEAFEFRTQVRGTHEDLIRSLLVHNRYGWVMEQRLMRQSGEVLVEAKASRHRYYPEHGVTLPQEVNLVLAPGTPQQMALQIYVGHYLINQLTGNPEALFQMPVLEGQPHINLRDVVAGSRPSPGTRRSGAPSAETPAALGLPERYNSPNSDLRTGYRPPPLRGFQR